MRNKLLIAALVPITFGSAASTTALAADNPYARPDGTWVSLSGTAVETGPDGFLLDYGQGQILVEMDDWNWYDHEGQGLIDGDEVRVFGEVDDDFAQLTTIEASSVYVRGLGSYFYANPADEEAFRYIDNDPIVVGTIEFIGTVSSVDGRTFTLDTGPQEITVDTNGLPYNPMDDLGFQKIEEGDLVSVSGTIDEDLIDDGELVADLIVTLREDNA